MNTLTNIKSVMKRTLAGFLLGGFSLVSLADDSDLVVPGDPDTLGDVQNVICNGNPTCTSGLHGLWQLQTSTFSDGTQRTCYCNEGNCPDDGVDVDLFPDSGKPYAYTDCSGWISYLLQLTTEHHPSSSASAAYSEVAGTPAGQLYGSYPKAFAYRYYFSQLHKGNATSDTWQSHIDLNNLAAGDILVYCLDTEDSALCNPDSDGNWPSSLGGDSGHIMLVLAAQSLTTQEASDLGINSKLPDDPYDSNTEELTYHQIAVIDSSSVMHTKVGRSFSLDNNQGSTNVTVSDSRPQYGDTDDEVKNAKNCVQGGVGSGVIYIAQIRSKDRTSYRWSVRIDDTITTPQMETPIAANVDISDFTSGETRYRVAFGRLN